MKIPRSKEESTTLEPSLHHFLSKSTRLPPSILLHLSIDTLIEKLRAYIRFLLRIEWKRLRRCMTFKPFWSSMRISTLTEEESPKNSAMRPTPNPKKEQRPNTILLSTPIPKNHPQSATANPLTMISQWTFLTSTTSHQLCREDFNSSVMSSATTSFTIDWMRAKR